MITSRPSRPEHVPRNYATLFRLCTFRTTSCIPYSVHLITAILPALSCLGQCNVKLRKWSFFFLSFLAPLFPCDTLPLPPPVLLSDGFLLRIRMTGGLRSEVWLLFFRVRYLVGCIFFSLSLSLSWIPGPEFDVYSTPPEARVRANLPPTSHSVSSTPPWLLHRGWSRQLFRFPMKFPFCPESSFPPWFSTTTYLPVFTVSLCPWICPPCSTAPYSEPQGGPVQPSILYPIPRLVSVTLSFPFAGSTEELILSYCRQCFFFFF